MAPQETQKLDMLIEQLAEHRTDFAVFRTEILGEPEGGEKATGRIPTLEKRADNHDRRIRRLEGFILMVIGAATLLKAIAWSAESIARIIEVLR